ncbi:reverse transcriptase domain-containing protein [Tanacetum coccineum]
MCIRLANRSFQYPVGIAENMLVEVGKFTFPADFVILEMEEDSKVPLILGRHFFTTADAVVIRALQDDILSLTGKIVTFMRFKEEIVLRHKVSEAGLELNKAKIKIMLLQEFDIKIKDKKGTKNVAADHLSRIENEETSDDSEVDDNFHGEILMEINTQDQPWFADFVNYLVSNIIPKGMTYQ